MKKASEQEYEVLEIKLPRNATHILKEVIAFLQLFLPVTLARRLVAIMLLSIGIPVKNAVELAGMCEKSMWSLKKQIREVPVAELMVIKSGSGRKTKMEGFEEQILAELETNNYHTRQQIVDMVREKFHVSVSRSAVGRLLKKRHQMAENRLASCQGRYGKAEGIF